MVDAPNLVRVVRDDEGHLPGLRRSIQDFGQLQMFREPLPGHFRPILAEEPDEVLGSLPGCRLEAQQSFIIQMPPLPFQLRQELVEGFASMRRILEGL